jgi:arginine-tRNA-protein transferase
MGPGWEMTVSPPPHSVGWASYPPLDFLLYKDYVKIDISYTISEYLLGDKNTNIFNSQMVQVRDEGKLISCGYFDIGESCIMGILNTYHPDYNKFSLGKFNILLKMIWGLKNNFDYYYTGYISPQVKYFDYKLYPFQSLVEFLNPYTNMWEEFPKNGKIELLNYSIFKETFE